MGINTETVRFLSSSRGEYPRVLTLGAQSIYAPEPEIRRIALRTGREYRGALWPTLGATLVEALDVSGYEGAEKVHDLNYSVPESWHASYDAVCDFGTLEHVFNTVAALKNCLQMVAVGGKFFSETPANNFFGHGFVQLGPEFFSSVLVPENGFRLDRLRVVEFGPVRKWHSVVGLSPTSTNMWPASVLVEATRTELRPIFASFPQQRRYAELEWVHGAPQPRHLLRLRGWVKNRFPGVATALDSVVVPFRDWSFRNPAFRRERKP